MALKGVTSTLGQFLPCFVLTDILLQVLLLSAEPQELPGAAAGPRAAGRAGGASRACSIPQACLQGIHAGSRPERSVSVCREGFPCTRQPRTERGVSPGPPCPFSRCPQEGPAYGGADKGMAVPVSGIPAAPGLEQHR